MKRLLFALIFCLMCSATPLLAQLDGTRVYWPLPKNMNIVGVHAIRGTVNATLTNLHFIQPSLDIDNELYLLTYTRSQPVLGRSFMVTASLPMGVIQTDSSLPVTTNDSFVHGVGDLSLATTINLVGAPGLMLREYARYDLRTVLWLNLNATLPVGQYNPDEPLNVGSNQTRLRLGLPFVQAFGPWVPGNRTTLEIMPSITLISDNDDFQQQTIEQDPFFAIEAHLTRDFTRNAAISLDYSFLRFGDSKSFDNNTGMQTGLTDSQTAHLLGVTLNFKINDNLSLFATHMQTLGSDEETPIVLEGALVRATLTWSFHRVIERRRTFMD